MSKWWLYSIAYLLTFGISVPEMTCWSGPLAGLKFCCIYEIQTPTRMWKSKPCALNISIACISTSYQIYQTYAVYSLPQVTKECLKQLRLTSDDDLAAPDDEKMSSLFDVIRVSCVLCLNSGVHLKIKNVCVYVPSHLLPLWFIGNKCVDSELITLLIDMPPSVFSVWM